MNLTDDEIRVKVATLMGWLNIHPSGRLDGQKIGTDPKFPVIGEYKELPNYPASVDAALSLCDRLRDAWNIDIFCTPGSGWKVVFSRLNYVDKLEEHDCEDPSAARAICLAFLKVKDSIASSP